MKARLVLTFFILGFLYRLWFIQFTPQPFAFDQVQYHDYAIEMLRNGLYAHTFRIYGYPLFVTVIYKFTGIVSTISTLPWQILQAFIDTCTAVVIFLLAKKIFRTNSVSYLSYLLYLFNPFTPGFVGVLLPEVLTIFLVAVLFFLFFYFLKKINLAKVIILGILLGFITQVRPFLFLYCLVILGIASFILVKNVFTTQKKIASFLLLVLFYFIPFTYNILGNFRYFGEFAFMDVDNLFLENLYIGLFLERSPDIKLSIWDYPSEVRWAFETYSYTLDPKDIAGRNARKKIFLVASLKEIFRDPYKFLSWRIKKLWYVWEKHTLYPYINPKSDLLTTLTYWFNVTVLLLAFIGIFSFTQQVRRYSNNIHKWFLIISVLLFFNASLVGAMTSAQERYSLPAYPIIYLYFGLGIFVSVNKLIKIAKRRHLPRYA